MTTLSRSYPVARKPHRCDSCGSKIYRGDRYHRWTGLDEAWQGPVRVKECAYCSQRYGRPIPEAEEARAA